MPIQKSQKDTLMLLGGIGAVLTGLIAVITYINTKDHRKMQQTNAKLDQELKLLELEFKK
jgi:uncharacterized membrane protein (DUF106 family)